MNQLEYLKRDKALRDKIKQDEEKVKEIMHDITHNHVKYGDSFLDDLLMFMKKYKSNG